MIDLYTFGTPNGQKISIALEEMNLKYKVHKVDITKGDQHKPEFLAINPNGKIPAIVDGSVSVFESISILIYLAEKTGRFIPKDPEARRQTLTWCLFQAANIGPMFGQFGHFAVYAKEKIPYAINRYQTEVQRLLRVLDKHLAHNSYLAGEEYTIADMATFPWLRGYEVHYKQTLDAAQHPNLLRWYREIEKRPAVEKGLTVPA